MNLREDPPPLGSWARIYALVIAFTLATFALLYWLTATFDIPLP
jgi:hypothetical protein